MKPYWKSDRVDLYLGDCLEVMPQLPDQSIDFICTDLPYGILSCEWDVKIPLDKLWEQYKRLIKPRGAIALFGTQPFTSELVLSNREWFKYEWIWEKSKITNVLNAHKQPVRQHESIAIFYKEQSRYFPQGITALNRITSQGSTPKIYGKRNENPYFQKFSNYPRTVLKFSSSGTCHSSQKPIALLQYLISTYTAEGDTVLDSTAGSGSTLVAAQSINRRAIGIELDPNFCSIAAQRLGNLDPEVIKAESHKTGQITIWDIGA